MLKFLIFIAAAFVLYRLFTGDKKKKEEKKEKETRQMASSGEMVKDPVCGTYVPVDSDIRVRQGEKVHTFCSFECRDRFLEQIEASSTGNKEVGE
jgi:YHS domain-containing protein